MIRIHKRKTSLDKSILRQNQSTSKMFLLLKCLSYLVIEEANWLTLYDDIKDLIGGGFDAVICLGNSFAHMTDSFGDQREQKQAIRNFEKCVKPGGLLLIDHRNYDNIMETGSTPSKCIYYNVS